MIKEIFEFIKEVFKKMPIILRLAFEDFKKKFAGSMFGVLWSFVQPIVTTLVLWFVFSVGFRSSGVKDVPFICWMLCGLVPWYYFSDALSTGSCSLLEYKFILKQMSFNSSIIPLVKIISSIFTNLIFIIIMIVVLFMNKIYVNYYWIQVIYYFLCMLVLVLGLSWLTSAIKLFFSDIGEIINVVLQIGMWFTPILWDINIVPDNVKWIFKLNPLFYVVQGYRDSLLYNIGIMNRIPDTIYFWSICIVILILGIGVFSRLKHYFNDVI